jgi:hypothetical protein
MKKIFTVVMAVAFAFSVAGFAVAAEKSVAPAAAKKAADQKVSGTIEALDVAAGTFTVKGKTGNVDLKAGKDVKLDTIKVGDKVYVKYADGTASSVKGVKATGRSVKKAAKKAGEKVEDAVTPAEKK